LIEQAEMR
jgi:hypothetical protein